MSWLLRDEVLEPVQTYAELCREAGHSPASVALAWVLRNQNVSSAIVGASRPEQIEENVKALDLELEPDFVEAIEKALAPATLFDPGFTFSPARRSEM
jgi:aryl-alcohol dehydrogenase-like predicted oxidoreductase